METETRKAGMNATMTQSVSFKGSRKLSKGERVSATQIVSLYIPWLDQTDVTATVELDGWNVAVPVSKIALDDGVTLETNYQRA